MAAARLAPCFSALARKSARSMSPFAAVATATTFIPAITLWLPTQMGLIR